MKGNKLIDDHKQIAVNLLKYKTHGNTFEVAIEPDKAVAYKEGEEVDIEEIIQAQRIFVDMKKGLETSEAELQDAFETTEPVEVAKIMLEKGEIQFTQKYREELASKKEKQVITYIAQQAMNPKTKLPHPVARIEAAIEEAKIRIDPLGKVKEQAKEIVKKLQPIIPIVIQELERTTTIPAQIAGKLRSRLAPYIKNEDWLDDGSLHVTLTFSPGQRDEIERLLQN